MTEVLVGVPLHETVVTALHAAWSRSAPHPVDTRDLLVALMRADTAGGWTRIWLDSGDADAIAGKVVLDPATGSSATWSSIHLTDSCALGLDVAWRLTYRYNLWPLPVGIMALGLVADDSSAAAQSLRDGLSRNEMLALLQSEILALTLGDIDATLAQLLSESRRHTQPSTPPPAPGYPLRTPPPAPGHPLYTPAEHPLGPGEISQRTRNRVIIAVASILLAILLVILSLNPGDILGPNASPMPTPSHAVASGS